MELEKFVSAVLIGAYVLAGYGCGTIQKLPKRVAISIKCTAEGNVYSHERENCFTREGYDK